MLKEEECEKIINIKNECDNLRERIKIEENKVLVDNVRGSSPNHPYIQHNFIVEGIQNESRYKRYKRMLKKKEKELDKRMANFEYELLVIDDSELRMILRYKYIDGLTNYQIANEMNKKIKKKEYTQDAIRMRIKRFFKKE